ncbi:MAG: ral stress protein [Ferruginibacter sp.]|uniref:pyridoxamine 5'-phosphate oxidase family protein n=1 Tax=Ferruginibacter sp. TaxID=1940288 RepID=UPI0026591A13|nr:pyridoxamine 5'-phosphate oxidase family protein [Ferruginibacter sp.]MDB5277089.1 ral stress protein [Ferruginibacter sp.]
MSTKNLASAEAIDKLKELIENIDICLFCTNLKTGDGATTRPMSTQEVDEEGNLWFFSDINSDKNREIKTDKRVQLFYSHPAKSSYVVVNGEAEIMVDRQKVDELWSPLVKTWFTEGKDDPNISILKVTPTSAYYWDTEGNRMINFFKMIASVATGKTLVDAQEGSINV